MKIVKRNSVNKEIVKAIIITGTVILAILFMVATVLYFLRKDKVGKSWYIRTGNGGYIVMYHGYEYVQVEKDKYNAFDNEADFLLSDEYLSRAPVGFGDYIRPKVLYARIRLLGDEEYPEYMMLNYGGSRNTVYLKRND